MKYEDRGLIVRTEPPCVKTEVLIFYCAESKLG